jgi:hypothetical protein
VCLKNNRRNVRKQRDIDCVPRKYQAPECAGWPLRFNSHCVLANPAI